MEVIHKQKTAELESLSEHQRTQQVPVPEDRDRDHKRRRDDGDRKPRHDDRGERSRRHDDYRDEPPKVGTPRRFAFVIPLSNPHGVIHVESNVTTGVHPTAT